MALLVCNKPPAEAGHEKKKKKKKSYIKIGDIRPVNKKDIPEKPVGLHQHPCAGEG